MDELISYLSERLTEYLVFNHGITVTRKDVKIWVANIFKGFQQNENQTVVISGGDCPDCGVAVVSGTGTLYDEFGNAIEVGKYECPECSHVLYC